MKKIKFLFLSLLLCSCTVQPAEPSNDDEPNENNEEIVEEAETNLERIEREYDKEFYDYDIIKYSSDLYPAAQGKIDPDKDYVYVSESAAGEDIYFVEDRVYFINNSSNDYYNWLTSFAFDKNGPRENVVINLQGEQIEAINNLTNEFYHLEKSAVFLTARYNVANDVLSVALWKQPNGIALSYSYLGIPNFINIDLRTNLAMSNEQLLERFGISQEQAQKNINENIERLGIEDCNVLSHNRQEINNCACSKPDELANSNPTAGYILSDISNLFIDDEGNLRMFIYLYGEETYNQYGGEKHHVLLMDVINPME